MKIKGIPTWLTLRKLGKNRIVKSAGIWAVIVPISAKFFEKIEATLQLKIFDAPISLHLSLPFSWKILFFVALAFMLANLAYKFGCPPLLQETDSYRDFENQKRSSYELGLELGRVQPHGDQEESLIINWRNAFANHQTYMVQALQERSPKDLGLFNSLLPEVYYFVTNKLSFRHQYFRLLASIFYSLGFAGLLFILIENIRYVVLHF